jgi:hypothetical protein
MSHVCQTEASRCGRSRCGAFVVKDDDCGQAGIDKVADQLK